MRLLGRLLLLMLLAGLVITAGPYEWANWRNTNNGAWEKDFSAYPVYWLDSKQSLNFEIPANGAQVRVQLTPVVMIVQGAVVTGNQQLVESGSFQVAYRTLDRSKKILSQTTRTFSYGLKTNNNRAERFFDQPDGKQAGLSEGLYIEASESFAELQIELQNSQLDNVRVAVRVSVLERKKDSDLPILWQRMHREKRAALMAGSIYPAELVSDSERRNALKFNWLPLGPTGIKGQAYQTATLFIANNIVVDENDKQDLPTPQQSNPMMVNESNVFTFIPRSILAATLRCRALGVNSMAMAWLELLIQDPLAGGEPHKQMITGEGINQAVALLQPDALYRVRASNLCQISLFDEQDNPVTAEVDVIRSYISQPDQALSYALALNSGAVQPIRLDVRGLQSVGLANSRQAVNWRILDHQGTNMLSGSLMTLTDTDIYESLPTSIQNTQSDKIMGKNSRYIIAPAQATTFVVEASTTPVLINVFTRPLALSYVPDELEPLPKWFMALPVDHEVRKVNGHSQLIYWQQRLQEPPLASAAELALAQWSALTTAENLATSELFSELPQVELDVNLNNYRPIPSTGWTGLLGNEVTPSAELQKGVSPSLVYIQDSGFSQALKVRVAVDNQPAVEYWLAAASGRFSLPTMSAGRHKIVIDGPPAVKWYINQTSGGEQRYRIRSAYPLVSPLTFTVYKNDGQEWVSFHYFPATNVAHDIEVKLMAQHIIGESVAHTIPIRRYSIAERIRSQGNSVRILNQSDKTVSVAQVLLFPLDEDLSNGQYQLKVSSGVKGGFIQGSYVFTNKAGSVQLFQPMQNTD
jgi:hypothetical protein